MRTFGQAVVQHLDPVARRPINLGLYRFDREARDFAERRRAPVAECTLVRTAAVGLVERLPADSGLSEKRIEHPGHIRRRQATRVFKSSALAADLDSTSVTMTDPLSPPVSIVKQHVDEGLLSFAVDEDVDLVVVIEISPDVGGAFRNLRATENNEAMRPHGLHGTRQGKVVLLVPDVSAESKNVRRVKAKTIDEDRDGVSRPKQTRQTKL